MIKEQITNFMLVPISFVLLMSIATTGHAESGKEIATRCTGCHGAGGASTVPSFPILAGQQVAYLVKQLNAFKNGSRSESIMQNMASGLSQAEINNVAAYFAKQPHHSAGGGNTADIASGKKKVAQCLGCHGNKAQGNGIFPKLAGQHPAYLIKQLKAFKNGDRIGGPMGAMSANLSEQDMKEIAAYLSSL